MFFSVIIPVYKDWSRLKVCINSLQNQKKNGFDFEIIIVDNEPEHNPPQFITAINGIKLIHEPAPGSYSARNRGAKLARGEYYAFTDSDCIPDREWLMNAKKSFEEQKCDLIGGRIDLFKEEKGTEWAYIYEKYTAFSQSKNILNGNIVTANLLVKKDVFNEINGFDDSLKSGGDWDFSKRASNEGFLLHYADDVIVMHPARKDVKQLLVKQKRFAAWGFIKAQKRFGYTGARIFGSNLYSGLFEVISSSKKGVNLNERAMLFLTSALIYIYKLSWQFLFVIKIVRPEQIRK